MKYLVVSENALYNMGGAEQSMMQYCEMYLTTDDYLTILCSSQKSKKLNYQEIGCSLNAHILKPRFIRAIKIFSLIYTQLVILLNLRCIIRYIKECEIILTQNRWAPYIVIISIICDKINKKENRVIRYFVRDEKCLTYYKCYNTGWRKLFWYIRHALEFPPRFIHRALTRIAFRNSHIIFNSNYMRTLAKQLEFDIPNSSVEYPYVSKIDKEKCYAWSLTQGTFIKNLHSYRASNVALIGGEAVKGFEYFEVLSQSNKDLNFLNFSKTTKQIYRVDNRVYFPWQSTAGVPYFLSQTVIVPSIWLEAFGRVVVEAKQFECDIFVSDQGGLPEALGNYERGRICKDLDEFTRYLKAITK